MLVKKFDQLSYPLRLFVRDPVRGERLLGSKHELYVGDVRYPLTLYPALDSVDYILCAIGSSNPTGDNNPRQVDYEGIYNVIEVAKSKNIKQFILVSSIAVTRPDHPLNQFGQVLNWKLRGEEALRTSGLDYTIVRPGGLKDEPEKTSKIIFGQGDHLNGTISRSDVADVCIQCLENPRAIKVTFEVISSEEGRGKTWEELFNSLKPD